MEQTLSLREAGEYDKKNNLKAKRTGWGKVCDARRDQPNTRKARVLRNRGWK